MVIRGRPSHLVRDRRGWILYMASERAAEDYCNEVVDGSGCRLHFDRVLSVRGLTETEIAAPSGAKIDPLTGGDPHGS